MASPPTQLVRVYFNDKSFKTFSIDDEVSTIELCERFAKKMRLKDTTIRHFSLNVIVNGQQIQRLSNLSHPYSIQKDYLAQNIGWGASNLNCFLFALKFESAKRMSACLTNPNRREITGKVKEKKVEQPVIQNGRKVISAAAPTRHVANAGIDDDTSPSNAQTSPRSNAQTSVPANTQISPPANTQNSSRSNTTPPLPSNTQTPQLSNTQSSTPQSSSVQLTAVSSPQPNASQRANTQTSPQPTSQANSTSPPRSNTLLVSQPANKRHSQRANTQSTPGTPPNQRSATQRANTVSTPKPNVSTPQFTSTGATSPRSATQPRGFLTIGQRGNPNVISQAAAAANAAAGIQPSDPTHDDAVTPTPTQTSAETPTQTPIQTPTRSPIPTHIETPDKTPEATIQTPAPTPAANPTTPTSDSTSPSSTPVTTIPVVTPTVIIPPLVINSQPPSSEPVAIPTSPKSPTYNPFPFATSSSSPPMPVKTLSPRSTPSLVGGPVDGSSSAESSPPISPRADDIDPLTSEKKTLNLINQDSYVSHIENLRDFVDKAKNNVDPTAEDMPEAESEADYEEYEDLMKVLVKLSTN